MARPYQNRTNYFWQVFRMLCTFVYVIVGCALVCVTFLAAQSFGQNLVVVLRLLDFWHLCTFLAVPSDWLDPGDSPAVTRLTVYRWLLISRRASSIRLTTRREIYTQRLGPQNLAHNLGGLFGFQLVFSWDWFVCLEAPSGLARKRVIPSHMPRGMPTGTF